MLSEIPVSYLWKVEVLQKYLYADARSGRVLKEI